MAGHREWQGGGRGAAGVMLLAALAASGCATMVNGRHQEVRVVSTPPGAAVWLNGTSVGTTPTTVTMRRRGPAQLRLEKAGYLPATTVVAKRMSGWTAVNLIYLNPLAAQGMDSVSQWAAVAFPWVGGMFALDALTGGGFTRPGAVSVVLAPEPPPGDEAAGPRRGAVKR